MKVDIVFTGGGTAGHVTPNLALIDALDKKYKVAYIGSKKGIEARMIADKKIPYYAVRSGKLRRYFSFKNFIDPFNLLIGIIQAFFILLHIRPKVVFSKGGFVALPVVISAWCLRIPVIAHESDLSPGLSNRLSYPFVTKICVTFDKGKEYFKKQEKVVVTGTPIRPELLKGSREKGKQIVGFAGKKPCLLVMGGSLGAKVINDCVRKNITTLCEHFDVIHLCGKENVDGNFAELEGYYQQEYATDELPDLFAACDIVLSRAGANALYELLALKKPHLLVPLSKRSSRGDQIVNAKYFQEKEVSVVLPEENLTPKQLLQMLEVLYNARETYTARISALDIKIATPYLLKLIKDVLYS